MNMNNQNGEFDSDLVKLLDASRDFAEYEKITASSGVSFELYPQTAKAFGETGFQYPLGMVVSDKDARCLLGTHF